jgi:hypothetical protein
MWCFKRSENGLIALILPLLVVCGCRSTMGPKMPQAMSAPAITGYKAADFNADVTSYRAKVATSDLAGALTLRNQIAYRVMGDIEENYSRFEMNLTTQRAGFETGSDVVQLGMSAAATLVGATDVKNILTASLTAFQGTRTSFDKNFFQQKTTESIISQMRATRKTKQAQLITNLAQRGVASYPWDAVWIDLVDFYYAGTVPSALVEIASGTGTKADLAADKLNKAVAALTPRTQEQATEAVEIREEYQKLAADANGPELSKSKAALESLQKILIAAGYKPDENATAQDLLNLFRKAIGDARTDNDKLANLSAAVTAEKVQ